MSKKPDKPTPPPELDPRIADLVQREVQAQMGQLLSRLGEELAAAAARPRLTRPGGKLDGRTVAVLTAAATAALGDRAIRGLRIRKITYLNQNTISAWAEMGRVMIHSSHNLNVRRTLE